MTQSGADPQPDTSRQIINFGLLKLLVGLLTLSVVDETFLIGYKNSYSLNLKLLVYDGKRIAAEDRRNREDQPP